MSGLGFIYCPPRGETRTIIVDTASHEMTLLPGTTQYLNDVELKGLRIKYEDGEYVRAPRPHTEDFNCVRIINPTNVVYSSKCLCFFHTKSKLSVDTQCGKDCQKTSAKRSSRKYDSDSDRSD